MGKKKASKIERRIDKTRIRKDKGVLFFNNSNIEDIIDIWMELGDIKI